MNECRELEPLLAAYVDDAAAAAERARVESHVDACPTCRDRLAGQRAAHEALHARRAKIRGCAPDGLKARCALHARREGSRNDRAPVARFEPRVPAYRRWFPVTAAATLVLAVAAVFGLGLTEKSQALAFQVTMDHVKCVRFNMGTAAADPQVAAQQWQARFGWPIKVPASTEHPPLELRAIRRCAVTDGRVAHLLYMWEGAPLSVYVLPAQVVSGSASLVRRFGHHSVIWSQNNRTYIVVADRRDSKLDTVVAYVRANAY